MTAPPKPAPTLRVATLADVGLVNELHVRSRRAAYRGQVSDHYLDVTMPASSLDEWQRLLPELLANGGRVWIAQIAQDAVGFVCAVAPDANGSVYIDSLHAQPDRKGLGIGTTLLDAAAHWARGHGARAMHLRVLETNTAAIGFYEARGWRRVDREQGQWGDSPIVSLIYALALT